MKKLKSTLPNMLLSLGTITIIAGGLLGLVYSLTSEPIAEAAANAKIEAIAAVVPPFDNNPEEDAQKIDIGGSEVTVFPAYQGRQLVGAAVKATSMNGFAGEIEVICGFDTDGKIRDYRVLSQAETPGLGAKMEMWFRDPVGARSVLGSNPSERSFYVVKDTEKQGSIDGITAATISSRAFLETLRAGYMAYRKFAADKGINLLPPKNTEE